jgi:SAM-dependent methyltransferase
MSATTNREASIEDVSAWAQATAPLWGWIAGAQALGLLRAAIQNGVLEAARSPATQAEIAAATGIEDHLAQNLCTALLAHGIVTIDGDRYSLSQSFGLLTSPGAPLRLADVIGPQKVTARVIESLGSGEGSYTALSADDVLTMAVGNSFLPSNALGLAWHSANLEEMHELKEALSAGGRYLELGCGAGGTLMGPLALYPQATGVGIEINEAVAEEAKRRAKTAGMLDRVEVRQGDALDLTDSEAFDVIWWSQQFFPTPSRPQVLRAAWRALKPGGYLYAPILGEPPATAAALAEPGGRAYSLNRLTNGVWDIPWRTADELRAEIEAEGFEYVRIISISILGRLIVARRPI